MVFHLLRSIILPSIVLSCEAMALDRARELYWRIKTNTLPEPADAGMLTSLDILFFLRIHRRYTQ